MKILWISGILIGAGLIAWGAIYHYNYGTDTDYVMLTGFGCMALGMLARRQVFRGK